MAASLHYDSDTSLDSIITNHEDNLPVGDHAISYPTGDIVQGKIVIFFFSIIVFIFCFQFFFLNLVDAEYLERVGHNPYRSIFKAQCVGCSYAVLSQSGSK